ncbi:hypothetical protein PTKIN_Ptkin15bG0167900 [Pterospermum kingtungense]
MINHESHKLHPLFFDEDSSNQSEETLYCSGCYEQVFGPCFSCVACRFYLHKKCAQAPSTIILFFHEHPLSLRLPSGLDEEEIFYCQVCRQIGTGFMYHCPICEFRFHINCALLPSRTAADHVIQTEHFSHQHPLIFIENNGTDQSLECFGCSAPIVGASYVCFLCDLYFHKSCVELPFEIDHPYHRKHQLFLELETTRRRFCNLCQSKHRGFFYGCSPCNVDIHSGCAWPPPIIEDKIHHQHPFTLLLRPNSFTCDACGTQGDDTISYICSTCSFQVHKKCISLPLFIGINLHHHAISRKFFVRLYHQDDSKTWDCKICYQKVNMEHGSYICSKPECNFVVHVNCAIENRNLYDVIELENGDEAEKHNAKLALLYSKPMDCITSVIKRIKVGEDVIATEIIHISHEHNLTLSDEIEDNKHCNGCGLPILSSVYHCSECDFSLHKACAELSRKRLLWYDARPFTLHTEGIFNCWHCSYDCSGFSYKLDEAALCLRCASLPHSFTYQAHEPHHLFFDKAYKGHCSCCGNDQDVVCRCKDCDFALDMVCITLPKTVWHKCDEHPLTLAYQDYNDYPLHHYCDICEEGRNPKHWFYHCQVCDTAVHPKCALGKYSFLKPGTNYTYEKHPHPLSVVQKIYFYPKCVECRQHCQDRSLECVEHGCNYVAHWECIRPFY